MDVPNINIRLSFETVTHLDIEINQSRIIVVQCTKTFS